MPRHLRSILISPVLIALVLLTYLGFPSISRADNSCPNAAGQRIFKAIKADFIGTGWMYQYTGTYQFYFYNVTLDLAEGVAARGNGWHLQVHINPGQYGIGASMLDIGVVDYVTHYEAGGAIRVDYVPPGTASVPANGILTMSGPYCFDSGFTIPIGPIDSTEKCDGLDNNHNGTVDDVPGGCTAQAVPVCNSSLDCLRPEVNACPDESGGPFVPGCGQTFNARLGNERRTLPLFSASSPGPPLGLTLFYNNRNESGSSIPGRWFTNYDVGLSVGPEGPLTVATVRWPDGTRSRYTTTSGTLFNGVLSDGSYVEEFYTNKPIGWDLHYHDGLVYHFSGSGILESMRDGKGNSVTLTYGNPQDLTLPTSVSDNYNHTLTFNYATSGADVSRLLSVTDPAGRTYDFAYQNFLLRTVTLPVPNAGNPRPFYEMTYADSPGFSQGGYKWNLTQIQFHPDAANPDPQNDRVLGKWNYDHSSRVASEQGAGGALGSSVAYNASNTTVTDSRGAQRTYGFNFTNGLTLTTTIPCPSCGGGTASSTLIRNSSGKITSQTDFKGAQTTWANHDSNGDPGTVTEAMGTLQQRTTTYTYHPFLHTRLSIVEPSALLGGTNKVTIFDYQKPSTNPPADPPANPTADLNPASFNVPGINNANFDNVVHRKIESGWTRDAGGNNVRVATVTHYSYDSLGRLTQIDGPRTDVADVTILAYYADSSGQGTKQGQLHTVTNAAGHVVTFNDYDAMGNVLSVADLNGVTRTYTYDSANRMRTLTQVGAGPSGENLVTENVYEANGNLDFVKLPRGNFINYQYDAANRLVSITGTATQPASSSDTPSGETIVYSYDTEGNRIKEEVKADVSGTLKRFTDFEYDALDRLKRVYNPVFKAGQSNPVFTETAYDANGNRTALDLFKNSGSTRLRHSEFMLDALDRLSQTLQDDGPSPGDVVTAFSYDVQDSLASVVDARGHDTVYTTDDFGRQVNLVSPDTGTTRFTYDPAGNLLQKSENGTLTQYSYDALNRPAQITFPSDSTQNLTYVYDTRADGPALTNGLGRMVKLIDSSGTTYFSYDKRGNRTNDTRVQDGRTLTLAATFDENGNPKTLTYPSGRQVAYTYDTSDRPTMISMTYQGNTTVLASAITYDPFGPFTSLIFGNGLNEARSYDVAGQVQTIHLAPPTRPALLDLDYTLDETENITAIADTLGSSKNKTYGYDLLDRLTTASIGGLGSFAYSYDPTGNRTQAVEPAGTTNYAIKSTNNQINSLSGAQTGTFAYNAHGDTASDGQKSFTYNLTHQLIQAAEGATTLGTYQYDGLSRRTAKTVDGLKRLFVYGGHYDPMGEYDDAGNLLREYFYLGTLRLALAEHDLDDDAVRDEADNCLQVANGNQTDQDADALGDACDAAPTNPDRDGDTLLDGQEDKNKNGVKDADETDSNLPDTDGDGFSDGVEVAQGSNPLDPNSTPNNNSVPTLGEMGATALILVLLGAGGWATRKRWPRGTTWVGLLVMASSATFIAPAPLKSQGGPAERILYIHTDHLGTPLLLTDGAQQVVWRGTAEPFGKTTPSVNQAVFNLRFPGQYEDLEIGRRYNLHRYYSATVGGYLQPDPIESNLNSPYSYAELNPIRYIDPMGLYHKDVHYDLTYRTARMFMSEEEARAIATSDQDQDEKNLHNPWLWPYSTEKYHFAGRDAAVNLLHKTIEDCNTYEFGRSLHLYQDSYSHEGLHWYTLGQVPKTTSTKVWNIFRKDNIPDIDMYGTTYYKERDKQMVQGTTIWLRLYAGRCECSR